MNILVTPPDATRDFMMATQYPSPQTIGRYLMIEKTVLAKADYILVFGNQAIIRQSANTAAKLYHAGLAPKIIASGGKETLCRQIESHDLYEQLRQHGVPSRAIIVEDQSHNTQQNVLNSRDIIADSHERPSLIAVGHVGAGRRFLMTLKKNWPEAFAMARNVVPAADYLNRWPMNHGARSEIFAQMARIPSYLEAGFIAEVDIAAINEEASFRNKFISKQKVIYEPSR